MPDEKRVYLREEEVSRRLEPFRRDLAQGMKDEEASRLAEVPVRTVQRWRLRNGIVKPKGFKSAELAEVYAISTLGEGLSDAKHRARKSIVGGAWEPPVFVTREIIDYSLFIRVLDAAHRVLGMTEAQLVSALGVSPKSVEQGLAIYHQHIHAQDKRCVHCNALMDPTVSSAFCTTICERLYGK